MKTFLRTLLYFALIAWLGAAIFFPVVASVTFSTLRPDTHLAGSIVGFLLRTVHQIGLVSGPVLLAVLLVGPAFNVYRPKTVLAPMVLVLLMTAATAYSQFGIIPAMERDRIAAGGAINTMDTANPQTVDFNRLHRQSEHVEEGVVIAGLLAVILIAYADSAKG